MTNTTATTLSHSAYIARYLTLTSNLNLKGTASSSASSPFELPSLGSYIGFGGTVWHTRCFTHVTTCFSCSAATLYQQRVLTGWCLQCQLIEGENLTSCFENTDTSTLREPKGTDGQLWHVKESDIISAGPHYHTDLLAFRSLHATSDSSQ